MRFSAKSLAVVVSCNTKDMLKGPHDMQYRDGIILCFTGRSSLLTSFV